MADSSAPLSDRVAFFGAVTASFSHELKNVLATINEYTGLLDDQVQVALGGGSPLRPERLERVGQRLAHQVERGAALIAHLNKFAHTVDLPRVRVLLHELVAQTCVLCERRARLRQASLEQSGVEAGPSDSPLELDPFTALQVLHTCVCAALEAAAGGGTVTVALEHDGAAQTVVVRCSSDLGQRAAQLLTRQDLLQAAHTVGAELVFGDADPNRLRITWRGSQGE